MWWYLAYAMLAFVVVVTALVALALVAIPVVLMVRRRRETDLDRSAAPQEEAAPRAEHCR
jgi:hypothetical protein